MEVAQADAGVLGPAVASAAVVAAASDDDVGRLAVTIWLVGAVASVGVLLVGLARLRWLRASSSRVTDGPWHRLCTDLAQTCGLKRGVDLLFGPLPGFVATWGWRRSVVMLPASAAEWSADRMRVVLLHELPRFFSNHWPRLPLSIGSSNGLTHQCRSRASTARSASSARPRDGTA